jgi:hypothetical protein
MTNYVSPVHAALLSEPWIHFPFLSLHCNADLSFALWPSLPSQFFFIQTVSTSSSNALCMASMLSFLDYLMVIWKLVALLPTYIKTV